MPSAMPTVAVSSPTSGGMPAVGVPSAPPAPDREGLLLVVGVVVAAVLLAALWRGLGAYRERRAQAAAWRLGPWPVLPGDVSTRGELVRAFEYLAGGGLTKVGQGFVAELGEHGGSLLYARSAACRRCGSLRL